MGGPGTTATSPQVQCPVSKPVAYGVSGEVTGTSNAGVQGALQGAFPNISSGSPTAGTAIGVITGTSGTFTGNITVFVFCGN